MKLLLVLTAITCVPNMFVAFLLSNTLQVQVSISLRSELFYYVANSKNVLGLLIEEDWVLGEYYYIMGS